MRQALQRRRAAPEALLNARQVAEALGMSRSLFYAQRARLIAEHGLQEVQVSGRARWRRASLDRMIRDAAEAGRPILSPRGEEGNGPCGGS